MKKTNMTREAYLEEMAQRFGAKWQYMLQRYDVKMLLMINMTEKNKKWCTPRLDRIAERFLCPANVAVGDGVTIDCRRDAYAATVIRVAADTVTVQMDKTASDSDDCVRTFQWNAEDGMFGQLDVVELVAGRKEFHACR